MILALMDFIIVNGLPPCSINITLPIIAYKRIVIYPNIRTIHQHLTMFRKLNDRYSVGNEHNNEDNR